MDYKKDYDQLVYWMTEHRWEENHDEALKSARAIKRYWYDLSEVEQFFYKDSLEILNKDK